MVAHCGIAEPGCCRRVVAALLSHKMYLLISFRKSTPPPNRQLIVYHYKLEYLVDGFVGELTFSNSLVSALCQIASHPITTVPPHTITNFIGWWTEMRNVEHTSQRYLAHKKVPPPPRASTGPYAQSCCRVLGGRYFLRARCPCIDYCGP